MESAKSQTVFLLKPFLEELCFNISEIFAKSGTNRKTKSVPRQQRQKGFDYHFNNKQGICC